MMNNKKILINYLLYFAWGILICIIGSSNVFAFNPSDFHVQTTLENKTTQYVSTTYLNSPVTNPRDSGYAFSDVFDVTYVIENYSFSANKLYQLETHLTNQKFTNSNVYTVTDNQHNQSCLISYSDSIMNNDAYPRWAFQCPQVTNSISISIGNSSNADLWSGSGIFNWVSSVLWVTDNYTLDGTSDSSDNIINNANQNADRIINNQNQNTQDIINSIDGNLTSCHLTNLFNHEFQKGSPIDGTTNLRLRLKNTIPVIAGKTYKLTYNGSSSDLQMVINTSTSSSYPYTSVGVLGNPTSWVNAIGNTISFTANGNGSLSIVLKYSDNSVISTIDNGLDLDKFTLTDGSETCTNKLDDQTNALNDLNDTINDDDIGDTASDAADFITDFSTNTFGLTSIITAPLNLIQSLTSSTCTPLHLPIPYLHNKYLDLPCMSVIYSRFFGSFFTIYQTITYGIIAYWVCVRIFNQVKDFKNPEHDEIEVVDL